jgi:hypothetical protein
MYKEVGKMLHLHFGLKVCWKIEMSVLKVVCICCPNGISILRQCAVGLLPHSLVLILFIYVSQRSTI